MTQSNQQHMGRLADEVPRAASPELWTVRYQIEEGEPWRRAQILVPTRELAMRVWETWRLCAGVAYYFAMEPTRLGGE